MTIENHKYAEKFLKEKYITGNENTKFDWNEMISILAEYGPHFINNRITQCIPTNDEIEKKYPIPTGFEKEYENSHLPNKFRQESAKFIIEQILKRLKKP